MITKPKILIYWRVTPQPGVPPEEAGAKVAALQVRAGTKVTALQVRAGTKVNKAIAWGTYSIKGRSHAL
jgi:hypothetical protein